ncbi:MAG: DUF1761 domain-containing protein [Treponemataceae bacterium]|nr:DUF1761 domain-containing protein [Treponemataceae bacterium]
MSIFTINIVALLLSILASLVIGSFWFSPKVFFPSWWNAIGKGDFTEGDQRKNKKGIILTFLGLIGVTAVQGIFLMIATNLVIAHYPLHPGIAGVITAFFLWVGIVAPTSLTNKLFADQLKAWLIEQGNHLLTMLTMGLIIGLVR